MGVAARSQYLHAARRPEVYSNDGETRTSCLANHSFRLGPLALPSARVQSRALLLPKPQSCIS